jgi:hypothetical protein
MRKDMETQVKEMEARVRREMEAAAATTSPKPAGSRKPPQQQQQQQQQGRKVGAAGKAAPRVAAKGGAHFVERRYAAGIHRVTPSREPPPFPPRGRAGAAHPLLEVPPMWHLTSCRPSWHSSILLLHTPSSALMVRRRRLTAHFRTLYHPQLEVAPHRLRVLAELTAACSLLAGHARSPRPRTT